MKVKIEDKNNLYRDINTGAVINNSKNDLLMAKESKKRRLSQEERINTIEEKLDLILNLITKGNKE